MGGGENFNLGFLNSENDTVVKNLTGVQYKSGWGGGRDDSNAPMSYEYLNGFNKAGNNWDAMNRAKLYAYNQYPSDNPNKAGLQIFNRDGDLIYDSSNKYMDILDVVSFKNFDTDFNRVYDYGRDIALIIGSTSSYIKAGQSKGYRYNMTGHRVSYHIPDNSTGIMLGVFQISSSAFKFCKASKTNSFHGASSWQYGNYWGIDNTSVAVVGV